MLTLHSYPHAILHVDADAFFSSVEQAIHPEYRGKVVITGKERNIVACASYEAKRLGIQRAIPLHEALKICPDAIILPSDYETYSLFSKRMFAIMRQFTPVVEEYSIDEGFGDLTGLRGIFRTSYENIASRIKQKIESELGITVSIGLSLSKSLAKLSSKKNKPAGFSCYPGRTIHKLLGETPLEKVWGFGPNITARLMKSGLQTAYDFVSSPRQFAQTTLGKIGDELWRELRGEYIYKVTTEEKNTYQSISKMKTFTPPSSDQVFIYGQLIRNIESACIKARRYHLAPQRLGLYLREDNFEGHGIELRLSRPTSQPMELAPLVRCAFDRLFIPTKCYRLTGVVLHHLSLVDSLQPTLFDDPVKISTMESIASAIDAINDQFGKHTVHLASSLVVNRYKQHQGERGDSPLRRNNLLQGETKRQRLQYPMLMP